jgi:hypothetical protein
MQKTTTSLSDNMDAFRNVTTDYSKYEISFRRWLVSEIDSGRMSIDEARKRFHLPVHFSTLYRQYWQPRYSEELHLSLSLMSSKERADNKALQKRIQDLEKQLELAQMKNVALNTMIDIAEQDYKLEIRKKFGPKQ